MLQPRSQHAGVLGTCLVIVWQLAATSTAQPSGSAFPDPCRFVTTGLDSSLATSSAGVFLGSAPGQTFVARDTLILALRVWRVALQDTNYMGMKLFITETDNSKVPRLDRVIQEGPSLFQPFGHGTPLLFEWKFDPPIILPGLGTYAFFLQQDPCVLGYFDVLSRGLSDLYPAGQLWLTNRSLGIGCGLRDDLRSFPNADIIFQVDFCKTPTTPARRATWGSIKTIYR